MFKNPMADNLKMLCTIALADGEVDGALTRAFIGKERVIADLQAQNRRLLNSLNEKTLPIIKIIKHSN